MGGANPKPHITDSVQGSVPQLHILCLNCSNDEIVCCNDFEGSYAVGGGQKKKGSEVAGRP